MLKTAFHYQALPTFADKAAIPSRIQLLPAGVFSGRDGRGPYRVADMAALITASGNDGPIIIDICHSTDLQADTGADAPAVGRVTELVPGEDGGLWAEVKWNAKGRQALEDEEYFGISPVFNHDESGVVVELLRASLTNIPNLRLPTLNRAEPAGGKDPMDLETELRKVFELDDKADAKAIVTHATNLKASASTHALVATAVGQPATASADDIVKAVQSRSDATTVTSLQSQVTELKGQLTTLTAERTADQVATVVEEAIKEGRALPAEREALVIHCTAVGVDKFKAAMAVRQQAAPGAAQHRQQPATTTTDDDGSALGKRAAIYQAAQAKAGVKISIVQAVKHCQENPEAGK